MAALAEMDLDTLTPEQAAAARQALAALETLRAENEAQSERIRRLEHLNLELIRLLYGKRSEKLSADERQLAFEELEGASAEVEAAAAPEDPSPARPPKRPRPARNLGHLPDHLPRIEQVIEPESTLCPCGCGEMVRIGEDRAERLDIVPAQLRVIVTVRPKYACRRCEGGVIQAPAPARLIEGRCRPKAPSPMCWSRNTLTIPPSIVRPGSTPVRGWSWTARRWPAGSARRRSTSGPCMTA